MAEILIEMLAAAGDICIAAVSWFYPVKNRTTFRIAAGCLVFFVGMGLVALLGVMMIAALLLK